MKPLSRYPRLAMRLRSRLSPLGAMIYGLSWSSRYRKCYDICKYMDRFQHIYNIIGRHQVWFIEDIFIKGCRQKSFI